MICSKIFTCPVYNMPLLKKTVSPKENYGNCHVEHCMFVPCNSYFDQRNYWVSSSLNALKSREFSRDSPTGPLPLNPPGALRWPWTLPLEASRSLCMLCVHTTPLSASVPYFSFQNLVTLVLLVHCKCTLVQSIWHVHCFFLWFVAALLSSKLKAFVNNIMPCKVTGKAGYLEESIKWQFCTSLNMFLSVNILPHEVM